MLMVFVGAGFSADSGAPWYRAFADRTVPPAPVHVSIPDGPQRQDESANAYGASGSIADSEAPSLRLATHWHAIEHHRAGHRGETCPGSYAAQMARSIG